MNDSNIIDLKQYRKMRKNKLNSYAFRVQHDQTAYSDALLLLIFSSALAGLFIFLFFLYLDKIIN